MLARDLELAWDLVKEPLRISESASERAVFLRRLPPFALPSPLPVEFVELVAGGEGRPEPFDEVLGLEGRTGRSGMEGAEFESREPINIADKGRCLWVRYGRRFIDKC